MTERRQKIRGTTAQLDQVIGAEGLVAYDTTLKELRVYDGVLQGGYRVPNLPTIDAAYKLPDRLKTTGKTLAGIDVVTVSEAGFYFTDATTIGLPTAAVGTLLVEPAGTGRNITWTRRSTYEKWGRSFDGASTWTAWQRIVDLNYLTTNSAAKAYDADRLDGQDSTYYTNIVSRLGYTPVNKAGDTGIGALSMTNLTTSGTATIGTNATVGGTLGVTGAVTLASTLQVNGNQIQVNGSNPRVYLTDSTAGSDDFWLYADADTVYILTDRADDGNWETPHPLSLNNTSATGLLYGNQILTTAMEGSGNGIDSDTVDGYHASDLFRDNADFTTTGNLTLSNTSPYIRLQDTTASAYDGRFRLDANNIYIDGSSDGVTYAEVLRFELDTKIGYMNSLFLTTSGEAIRLAAPTAGNDPYISFYQAATRTAYIQYQDGAGTAAGLRIQNDAVAGDSILFLTNDGGVAGFRYYNNGNNYEVYHSGNLSTGDIGAVPTTTSVTAGNGLTGGGALSATVTVHVGTPSDITNSTTNSVTADSHTHALGFIAAEVYTGTGANDTSFPLGHIVHAYTTVLPNRNASSAVYLYTGDSTTYTIDTGIGTQLSGTWRARGGFTYSGSNRMVVLQRVA